MATKVLLTLSMAVCMCLSPAFAKGIGDCGTFAVLSTEKPNGDKIEIFIDPILLEKSPRWSPENGDPPLSVSAAVQAGLAWARNRYSRYESVSLSDIHIERFGCSLAKNTWYYILTFQPVFEGNEIMDSGNWAAVLFDGTVVAPTRTPGKSNSP